MSQSALPPPREGSTIMLWARRARMTCEVACPPFRRRVETTATRRAASLFTVTLHHAGEMSLGVGVWRVLGRDPALVDVCPVQVHTRSLWSCSPAIASSCACPWAPALTHCREVASCGRRLTSGGCRRCLSWACHLPVTNGAAPASGVGAAARAAGGAGKRCEPGHHDRADHPIAW